MNPTQSHSGFPLRSDFFRSLPLAKFNNDKLYRLAKANALTCLNQSFNDQWRYVPHEKDGTQIRKDTSNMAVSHRLVRAATVLRCHEHEVNQVVANTKSESWREFVRKCIGKYYVDTLILHSVNKPTNTNTFQQPELPALSNSLSDGSIDEIYERYNGDSDGRRGSVWNIGAETLSRKNSETSSINTPTNKMLSERSSSNTEERYKEETAAAAVGLGEQAEELLTVKWAAFETGLSGKRDVCLVDYLSLAYVPHSEPRQRVHVWCFTSADGERVGCMELKKTHNVARTTLTKLGLFWRKVSEDETEVIVCGSFPSKHAQMISAILLSCLSRLQGIVENLRMGSQLYIQRTTWIDNNERTTCSLCTRNFHTLRRKHHCRRCGEVVCSDCSTVDVIDLPAIGCSKLRLCKVCSIRARTTPLKQLSTTNVFDHLVRACSLKNVGSSAASISAARSSCSESNQAIHQNDNSNFRATSTVTPGVFDNHTDTSFAATSEAITNSQVAFSRNSFDEQTISTRSPTIVNMNESTADVRPMSWGLDSPTETFDDFIDESCLKTQLCAMELKNRSAGSNRNMFDLLCELACQTLLCPIASISIVDDKNNSICSDVGLDDNSALEKELSIFIEKMMGSTPTIVLDASVDKHVLQFFPQCSLPIVRFFAGCPIYSRSGKKLGYVCVADFAKRDTLGASCAFTMERLATLAVTTLEQNRNVEHNKSVDSNLSDTDEDDFAERALPPVTLHPVSLRDVPITNSVLDRSHKTRRKTRNERKTRNGMDAQVGCVYEIVEEEMPSIAIPSTVHLKVARPAISEGSADFHEVQQRMRKLLLQSYHTQQQLATGGLQ
ncbi:hypothetical protein CCR75_008892 [Bremia lactucae]|uniref:FYVE-type domain-containing protein n=1 Tax=Bremia lactucae TaxID=4779 RepID=A0A976FKN9_BRELC|nr:hypothetical protein CCR75_008892 [Bremia lactucae]